jgi:hypothetical protein
VISGMSGSVVADSTMPMSLSLRSQHPRSVFDKGQPVWEHSLIFAGQAVGSHR